MHIFDHDYFISGIDISKPVKIMAKMYLLKYIYLYISTKVVGVFQIIKCIQEIILLISHFKISNTKL